MKKLIYCCVLLFAWLSFSCDEAGRIDQIDDKIPVPKPAEVTEVIGIPGGAVIKVKIPNDDNIKGIEMCIRDSRDTTPRCWEATNCGTL